MGFVGSLLSNDKGAGFQANGTNSAQLNTAYDQTQQGIKQQQDFVNQLNAQGGLGNQANVFAQQQGLTNQLQNVANGQGPNPAQAALAQATGANVSNQNALMAGQRGASQNVGLIARQAAMQGANTQQQAAGQGATLQAQQSLNALGQIGQQQANMANTAQNQVTNQQTGLNQLNNASSTQQANLLGIQGNQNSANAGIAGINAKGQGNIFGGVMQGLGAAFAAGGPVGAIDVSAQTPVAPIQQDQVKVTDISKPQSNVGKIFKDVGTAVAPSQDDSLTKGASALSGGIAKGIGGMFANGGAVPAMVSPGEKYLSPDKVNRVAQGASPMKEGETIPGKAKVKGATNSYSNDIVPKTLEEGGIVLPRSVTQSKDPAKAAHAFVSAILAKQGKSMPKRSK